MPNYALLATGQQAVTTVATALPQVVPPNPQGAGIPRGEGVEVRLACIGSQPLFYGNNNGVTTGNGKPVAAGTTDAFTVNDLSMIYVIAAANATATAAWSVTNK